MADKDESADAVAARSIPGLEWQKYYAAVGLLTARWAEFERSIDVFIWELAELEPQPGACITSQLPSVHARFRTLLSLLHLSGAPQATLKAANKIGSKATDLVMVRNRYAHNPTTFGLNDDMTDWQFYMNTIQAQSTLTFGLKPIELSDINGTIDDINALTTRLADLRDSTDEWRTVRRT